MNGVEIVLVTGGRGYRDQEKVWDVLDQINPERIIEGGASGVDRLSREWAVDRGKSFATISADWERYGKAAGPIRNEEMAEILDGYRRDGSSVLVVVFPGGTGTANMRSHAVRIDLPIYDVFDD